MSNEGLTFGQYIKMRREALGLSVRALAIMLEVTPVYLGDIEKGNRAAPRNHLEKLAELLRITGEEKDRLYDMAAETRGCQYEDINPYLGQQPRARVALRKARDMNLSDMQWQHIIEYIDGQEPNDE